jgi:hypothetical protein
MENVADAFEVDDQCNWGVASPRNCVVFTL